MRLAISDNGRGMPTAVRGGIGLTSMRERAEEIGGTLLIETAVGRGTQLTAVLPIPAER